MTSWYMTLDWQYGRICTCVSLCDTFTDNERYIKGNGSKNGWDILLPGRDPWQNEILIKNVRHRQLSVWSIHINHVEIGT